LTLYFHYANVYVVTIQKQIKNELKRLERYELSHRSAFARTGAMVLTLATLFSLTGLGHEDPRQRAVNREIIAQFVPVFNPIEKNAEKNETVRMPIKFDDGLRATSTTGE